MNLERLRERAWKALKERHRGKAAGLAVGALGGWFGAAMGLLIGTMIDALLAQRRTDLSISDYLKNPGLSSFKEPAPGSAAFCALAVMVADAEGPASLSRIAATARETFGLSEEHEAEFESFALAAIREPESLNPDLLAESLLYRRRRIADDRTTREAVCAALADLASGDWGEELASRISAQLCPERRDSGKAKGDDPFALLGVSPDATAAEVKAAYRSLAVAFHPDAAAGLDESQRASAAEAFLRIDQAYRKVMKSRSGRVRSGT